jgi:hypothetical protein
MSKKIKARNCQKWYDGQIISDMHLHTCLSKILIPSTYKKDKSGNASWEEHYTGCWDKVWNISAGMLHGVGYRLLVSTRASLVTELLMRSKSFYICAICRWNHGVFWALEVTWSVRASTWWDSFNSMCLILYWLETLVKAENIKYLSSLENV